MLYGSSRKLLKALVNGPQQFRVVRKKPAKEEEISAQGNELKFKY